MNRKMLFREKNCDNEWCYMHIDTNGQYTGLRDKNGNKIFEGDIVKVPEDWDKYGWNAGEKFIVIFDKGGFRGKSIQVTNHSYYIEDGNDFEIIGNIYDNPELLENKGK